MILYTKIALCLTLLLISDYGHCSSRFRRKVAVIDPWGDSMLWDPHVIPYRFAKGTAKKAEREVIKAMLLWQDKTCIKFRPAKRKEHYIRVSLWDKSYSSADIGFSNEFRGYNGYQSVDLSTTRGKYTVEVYAHELGHAISLWHEMGRPDRDKRIKINYSNIRGGAEEEFSKVPKGYILRTYGVPYDYGSIMQYAANAFAKDKSKPTIVTKDLKYLSTLGTATVPSFLDVYQINSAYECMCGKSAYKKLACENDGYPDVKKCTRCACPPGFGGTKCTVREAVAGNTLQASRFWKSITANVESRYEKGPYRVVYHIKAPKGSKIEFNIVEIERGLSTGDMQICKDDHVEIKLGNFRETGARFCSKSQKMTLVSQDNLAVVIINVNRYFLRTKIKYRLMSDTEKARESTEKMPETNNECELAKPLKEAVKTAKPQAKKTVKKPVVSPVTAHVTVSSSVWEKITANPLVKSVILSQIAKLQKKCSGTKATITITKTGRNNYNVMSRNCD